MSSTYSESHKKYYEENKELIRAKQSLSCAHLIYYDAHRDEVIKRQSAYQKANKDKVNARQRAYYYRKKQEKQAQKDASILPPAS